MNTDILPRTESGVRWSGYVENDIFTRRRQYGVVHFFAKSADHHIQTTISIVYPIISSNRSVKPYATIEIIGNGSHTPASFVGPLRVVAMAVRALNTIDVPVASVIVRGGDMRDKKVGMRVRKWVLSMVARPGRSRNRRV